MLFRKPSVRPVCCRVSGALGASGSPPVSQSMQAVLVLRAHHVVFLSEAMSKKAARPHFLMRMNRARHMIPTQTWMTRVRLFVLEQVLEAPAVVVGEQQTGNDAAR